METIEKPIAYYQFNAESYRHVGVELGGFKHEDEQLFDTRRHVIALELKQDGDEFSLDIYDKMRNLEDEIEAAVEDEWNQKHIAIGDTVKETKTGLMIIPKEGSGKHYGWEQICASIGKLINDKVSEL